MITHIAADGKSVTYDDESNNTSHLIRADDTYDDDHSEDDDDVICEPGWRKKTRNNRVLCAVIVCFLQIAVSVPLKRNGWIKRDINDIITDWVVPQLQETLGAQFNDSMYWQYLNQTISKGQHNMQERGRRPGVRLAEEGATGKYPIVMIPGFVTSGLEVWQGRECARKYFRTRMWGGVGSVQQWLMERHCVMEHLALDPVTGTDPEGIRIRAVQGFEAADYFMGTYWVWSKILENLADIGYDGSSMSMESYDWRLAFPMLEERDGYLTKLKSKIEAFKKSTGKKVVLTSHSLGAILVHYFFAWVTTSERHGGGGGGKDWVDRHIHAYVNIAGAHLGVPKAASALLSGEMSDTIFMGTVGSLVEQFIGRKLRRDLWTTWGSLWCMLPKGGDALWSVGADFQEKESPESEHEERFNNHAIEEHFLVMTDESGPSEEVLEDLTCPREDLVDHGAEPLVNEAIRSFAGRSSQTVEQVNAFLQMWGGGMGPQASGSRLHSFDHNAKFTKTSWHDITRTPLPYAPNMKVYCLYGVGLDTERAYFYKRNKGESQGILDNASHSTNSRLDPPFILDTSVEDPENDIVHGVKYVDGDGSVPLLSLGYMCNDAWRRKDTGLNPSKVKVVTREYKHRGEFFSVDDPMRQGPYSADHVDILGNVEMLQDFLKIVSDYDVDTVNDLIVSDIHHIAKRINEHPHGGLKKRHQWRNPFQRT